MNEQHQKRAVEWFLYQQAVGLDHVQGLIREEHYKQKPLRPVFIDTSPDGPELYGTSTSAEEGLWNRQGWAGRGG